VTDRPGSSDTGGAVVVGCQVAPSSSETSTSTGAGQGAATARELMGQAPTTAHTFAPMALTSETTGPTGARTQVWPPSDVTQRGTAPVVDGVPPHR
jgi:hypothetical protein